jgi:hypothetical protein
LQKIIVVDKNREHCPFNTGEGTCSISEMECACYTGDPKYSTTKLDEFGFPEGCPLGENDYLVKRENILSKKD